jgi:hypothetical protein
VERCFAAGSVIAQRNTNYDISAGGIAGRLGSSSKLKNSVALGASVTATGGATRNVGRVYGSFSGTVTFDNNHAYNGMRLYSDAEYGKPEINMTPTVPSNSDGSSQDGADAHNGNFGDSVFWTGLGFTTANKWITTGVGLRRHPILMAENGAAMAGQ